MIAVYPGSFDPITNGHLDLINRASKVFDKIIIAVLVNNNKTPLFPTEERMEMIKKCTASIGNIEVMSFSGLLIDFVERVNGNVILRGLRAVSDYEYELQMALTNKQLKPDFETVFFMASSDYSFLSSSVVKEIGRYGGEISDFVPAEILEEVRKKILTVYNI